MHMRIERRSFKGRLMLVGPNLIDKITGFPEHGSGYSLVDVTLIDGTVIEQVPIANGDTVCFYDDMKFFAEIDIASVAASLV